MKAIMKFAFQLGARFSLNADLTVNKAGRYFLLNKGLLKVARKDFYYAGAYLGKVKNGKFFPSFILLASPSASIVNKLKLGKNFPFLTFPK